MGKRSKEKKDLEYLTWKIKKLEKSLKHRQRKNKDSKAASASRSPTPTPSNSDNTEQELLDNDISEAVLPTLNEPAVQESTQEQCQEQTQEPMVVDTDENHIIELLGEDPTKQIKYADDIQCHLAARLEHIVTSGLSKEDRKELFDKFLPPGNCTLLDAPILNPEIKAAVSEAVLKRDKGIELKQKQLGHAIAGISKAITLLLAKEIKDSAVIKILMDSSRLLCDCQHSDSNTRRNFVLFNLKKDIKDQILKTKLDTFLFGSDLAETLKTAKIISRASADLKPVATKPAATNKPKPSVAPAPVATEVPQRNLNWKAPPPNRRPRGIQRPREPAQRRQPGNFSRPHYRPQPTSSRSRY